MSNFATCAERLCDENERLKAENAKLRGDVERMFNANVEKNGEIVRLLDENTKLRELVRALNWCTENFWYLDLPSNCDNCRLEQSDKLTPECEIRMRELRIGV